MMISIPRNCVADAHDSAMRPFSSWTSIRRCPSIRVIGTTTSFVRAMLHLLLVDLVGLVPGALDACHDRMGGHAGRRPHRQSGADHVRCALDAEAGDPRESPVEWRHRVPEVALGASDARMPSPDGPVGAVVPLND